MSRFLSHALWTKNLDYIRPILSTAIQAHVASIPVKSTIVSASDLISKNLVVGQQLPLIPDAAIHYRCGDNFVGHYGLLPFRAFTDHIPRNISTLYVLAEHRSRKTFDKQHLAAKCDAIFTSLLAYLQGNYPKTTRILIRRGDNLYTDFARLSLAKYVVCSVSTFCLWPAIVQGDERHVYFPRTKLIVGGNANVNLGFEWILQPAVLLDKQYQSASTQEFLKALTGGTQPAV